MSASDHTGGGREDETQDVPHPAPYEQPQWAAADSGTQVFSATPGGPPPPEGANGPGSPGDGGYPGGDPNAGGYGAPPQDPGAAAAAPGPEPKRRRGRVALVAAVTALITSLVVGPAATVLTLELAGSAQPLSSLGGGGQASSQSTGDVSGVAETALPSVVSIQVGEEGGSGVVISADGQILTNSHVVAQAAGNDSEAEVQVQFNDGEEATAELLGSDPVSDLAVLQAEGQSGRTPATLGDSDNVDVGADIVAIGSPLGLSGTVTSGVVSAVDRPVNTGVVGQENPDGGDQQEDSPLPGMPGLPGEQEEDSPENPESQDPQAQTSTVINAIQSDAPINPGNSGGPLMNMNGEVIGINTAIAGTGGQMGGASGSIGLGFAIPINQAQPIAEQLIEEGQANYAAIDATVTGTEDGNGVELVEASGDGAAAEAGLEDGDIVTEIDGEETGDPDKLIATVRSYQPGDTITVSYERGGDTEEVELTLSAQSAESIGE